MRKLLISFVVLLLAANHGADACAACGSRSGGFGAEGFTLGLKHSIEGINRDSRVPTLTGIAGFGHSFLNDTVNLYAELNYTFGFPRSRNRHPVINPVRHSVARCIYCDDDHSDHPFFRPQEGNAVRQSLYFNFIIGYNLRLGFHNETTLSFILQNEIDELIIAPRYDGGNNIMGVFRPAIRASHELNAGDIYARIGLPITYVQQTRDADTKIGLEATIGFSSLFGAKLETTLYTLLTPGNPQINGLAVLLGYEIGGFHVSAEAFIPIGFILRRGVNIIPHIGYTFRQWTFYMSSTFSHVGAHRSPFHVTPSVGVKINF